MSGFEAEWLALRKPADARARNRRISAELAAHFAGRSAPLVLDIGAGTGATMTALSPLLPAGQHWRLVDDDPTLLARAAPPDRATMEAVPFDLSGDISALLEPAPTLVTASAFFDLAGAAWIDAFVAAIAARRIPLHAALSYDGRETWRPAHRLDTAALIAFHADQQRDKGLGGPALGPDAPGYLVHRLERAGYRVLSGPSDWLLETPRDASLIAALASGSAEAIAPALGAEARAWADARIAAEAVTIGHTDILAFPR